MLITTTMCEYEYDHYRTQQARNATNVYILYMENGHAILETNGI